MTGAGLVAGVDHRRSTNIVGLMVEPVEAPEEMVTGAARMTGAAGAVVPVVMDLGVEPAAEESTGASALRVKGDWPAFEPPRDEKWPRPLE